MQRRRRIKQILTLEERLAEEAKRLREEAKKAPSGPIAGRPITQSTGR